MDEQIRLWHLLDRGLGEAYSVAGPVASWSWVEGFQVEALGGLWRNFVAVVRGISGGGGVVLWPWWRISGGGSQWLVAWLYGRG